MSIERLMEDLAALTPSSGLRRSAAGIYGMQSTEGIHLQLEQLEDADQLRLCAVLGVASVADRAHLLTSLLLANLVLSEHGRPCLALEAGGDRVVLTQVLNLSGASVTRAKEGQQQ